MIKPSYRINSLLFLLTLGLASTAIAEDATTELFHLLDKGDCVPSSLTSDIWTITTGPVGTHGQLSWGDELVFEQMDQAIGVESQSHFSIWKNGKPWTSENGWTGSCVRDGNLSLYVVTGDIKIQGCLHELAIGRLDHDDSLGDRVEVIFQDKVDGKRGSCRHDGSAATRHPGHAHGDNN